MAKSKETAAKVLHAALNVLKENGGELRAEQVLEKVEQRVSLDEHEKERYEKTGYIRWESILHFYSVNAVKAGYLIKSGGVWHLTPEGERVASFGPEELNEAASEGYRKWRIANPKVAEKEASSSTNSMTHEMETAIAEDHVSAIGVGDIETPDDKDYYVQDGEGDVLHLDPADARKIIWQAKDFSIREFHSMKQDGTLNLQPSYQRKYVMDPKLASKLVESILMDVPIPVIYLAEEKDASYSVIDGQQRLTSFISYVEGSFPNHKAFPLSGLKVLYDLNKKPFSELDKELQQKVRTTTIHTIIIKKESNEDIKFEIFERLNTGSIKLNEDEIRNTVYRGPYIDLLGKLENNEKFHKLVAKDNFKARMIYRGMILRFFALSEKTYINYKENIKQFCNKELRDNSKMSEEKAREYEERFVDSVDLVSTVFGDKAFRRFIPGTEEDVNGQWVSSRINMALFDIQMCGFVNYSKNQIYLKADELREAMLKLMSEDDEFIRSILLQTSGKNQMTTRFKKWMNKIDEILGSPRTEQRAYAWKDKKMLFDNDPTCKLCRNQIRMIDDAEVDHIIPFSKGGRTEMGNAQLAHRYCNRVKSDQSSYDSISLSS